MISPRNCGWLIASAFSASALATVESTLPIQPPSAASAMAAVAPLTLQDAIQYAVMHHPSLRESALGVEASNAAIRQAGLRPNPELEVQSENIARGDQTVSLWLSQPLELGGKRERRVALATADRSLAELEWEKQRARVVAEVRHAFMRALIWRQRVALHKENLEVMTTWAASVKQRVDVGKSSPLEGERARLTQLAAADALQRAEREWSIAMNELAVRLGRDEPVRISPAGIDSSLLPRWERVQETLAASPQARWLEVIVMQKDADYQLQLSVAQPDIRLSAGLQNDRASGANGVLLGLAIPIPIQNRNQGAIAQASLRVQQARLQAASARRELEMSALAAWERLRGLQKTIRLYDDVLIPGADQAFAKAREGYALGKFAFLDVLDAQRGLVEARTQQGAALLDYIDAEAQLEALLGKALNELAHASEGTQP